MPGRPPRQPCTQGSVCNMAIELADDERAHWLQNQLGHPQNAVPLCLNETVMRHEYSALRFRDRAKTVASPALMHVAFIDDRRMPAIQDMIKVAKMGAGDRTAYLALLRVRSLFHGVAHQLHTANISTVSIEDVDLPSHVKCIAAGLRRLVPRSSRMRSAALFKPMVHWILPRHVEQVLVIDTDVVPLRPLDGLHSEVSIMRIRGALIGLVPE